MKVGTIQLGAGILYYRSYIRTLVLLCAYALLAVAFVSTASTSYTMQAREMLSASLDEPIKPSFRVSAEQKMYRQHLGVLDREIYDAIEDGIRRLDTAIQLPAGTTESALARDLEFVMDDNPDIFWTGMEYSVLRQGGTPVSLSPEYLWDEETVRKKLAAYEGIADEIMSRLPDTDDPHLRLDEICRHVAVRATYEYDEELSWECQNIDSVFTDGRSVCAGYARAVQFVALKDGMRCSYVSGTAYFHEKLGAHAWNVLYDDDGNAAYYDATWGDNDGDGYESFWSARIFEAFPLHEPDYPTVFPKVV